MFVLNQGELVAHCTPIGMKDFGFYFQCISNSKRLFSKKISPKKPSQLCLDGKLYNDSLLLLLM